ncbi:MAG: hypothetical protein VX776_02905, partial [Planctomycetota bacterium]|nr:hypothetical protein [Planctomycetota bacterium]
MLDNPQFIYCGCQYGAQTVLTKEILEAWPEFKLSFSRPGFVTFKVPGSFPKKSLPTLDLKSTFARCYGISLGSVKVEGEAERVQRIQELLEQNQLDNIQHLHVWRRDTSIPGNRGFEPGRDA